MQVTNTITTTLLTIIPLHCRWLVGFSDDSLLISDTSCLIGRHTPDELKNSSESENPNHQHLPTLYIPQRDMPYTSYLNHADRCVCCCCYCVGLVVFAQNVMLQMGLRLISVSGSSITSTRQFLLKCHACFHLTRDMQRQFCPACGLYTHSFAPLSSSLPTRSPTPPPPACTTAHDTSTSAAHATPSPKPRAPQRWRTEAG